MNEEKLRREEYEIQFFGFSHSMLITCVRHVFKKEIHDLMLGFKENLKRKNEDEAEEVFDDVVNKLTNLYMNASKQPLQNLENTIEECMRIPDHVLLEEDEDYQRVQHEKVDMEEIDKEVEMLAQRAVKAMYMESMLQAELIKAKRIVDLGGKKVSELQKRCLELKQKDDINKELISKIVASNISQDYQL